MELSALDEFKGGIVGAGRVKRRNSLLRAPQSFESKSAIEVARCTGGTKPDCAIGALECFGITLQLQKCAALPDKGVDMIWVEGRGALEASTRLSMSSERLQSDAQGCMSICIVGIEGDDAAEC